MRTISPASRRLDSCGMWRDVFFIWPLYNFDWAEESSRFWGLLEGMRHEDEVPGLGGPLSTGEEVNPTRNLQGLGMILAIHYQWEIQDPKMEVLYHIRIYFVGIFPYIGLI